jgi:hypothetical protein
VARQADALGKRPRRGGASAGGPERPRRSSGRSAAAARPRRARSGRLGSGGRARGSGRAGPGAASGGSARAQARAGAWGGAGSGAWQRAAGGAQRLKRVDAQGHRRAQERSTGGRGTLAQAAGERWCGHGANV